MIIKGNLTTSSQLFPFPNAVDPVLRAQSFSLTDALGAGIEARYRFPESNVAIGISTDLIHTTATNPIAVSSGQDIPVNDGYEVVPVEITGYFIIPASGKTFGMFMGGGGGAYLGHRVYRIAGVGAAVSGQHAGYGIHVLGGVSYRFTPWFSLMAEMKFRDLQFTSTNSFAVSRVVYNGSVVPLPVGPLDSSVHTDGIVFQLGAAFTL